MNKKEYDFIEDADHALYKIYEKKDRGYIIAVCENVFDVNIVIEALNRGDQASPCDCSDEISTAIDAADAEHDEAIKKLESEHKAQLEEACAEAREAGHDEGCEKGSAEAHKEMKSTMFDPS